MSENQLSSYQRLGTQYVAHSGMEQAVSGGLLVGRPFGGVSIAWAHDLDHLITPLTNFRHKRAVGAELKCGSDNILLLCVYMPFYDASRRSTCMLETLDTLSMLENMIEQHPSHSVIIGGDLNTELRGNSPFDTHWRDFMAKNQLACCDTHFPNDSVTYHHRSLNQKKWNDHFLVSSSFLSKNQLSNFVVLDEGDNLSDHYPILMTLKVQFNPVPQNEKSENNRRSINWSSLSSSNVDSYTEALRVSTDLAAAPEVALQCGSLCVCDNPVCRESIQREYDTLISCLRRADSALPRQKTGVKKDWWTEGLSELKKKSIEVHSLWKEQGRPRQGRIHEERLRIRAAYKSALKAAKRAPKQAAWDRIHASLLHKDTNSFWKSWKQLHNKNKSELPSVVDGYSTEETIAGAFKKCFSKNSTPNNQSKVDEMNDRFAIEHSLYMEKHKHSCDCASTHITAIQVIDALLCMKGGKCADEDEITVEHLHNAPLNFLVRLSTLFNLMLRHSFVPVQFQRGFMIPLVKDQQGNHADSGNYRGITISPIISKVFEHVLKSAFSDYLVTSQNQFGFKKGSSTSHAIHCLRETVDFYINNGSRVFCTFLDASKAFDRLIHSGLFLKLMDRKIPVVFLNLIIFWYSDLRCRVKWGKHFSEWFVLSAGVRQGGILSPDFYSIYVDDLIKKLMNSHKGCYYFGIFAAALFYADDMAILSPSIRGLGSLLELCGQYCIEWDISLNAKKSKNLYFGKRLDSLHHVTLNGSVIEWVNEWTYLGVTLRSNKCFDCSISERIKKFYRSSNAILRIEGRSNDAVMLQLIESHCVPILTYAIEVVHVSNRDERRQLRVAYNSVYRKIFHYRWTESVSALQSFLRRPTWEQLIEKRRQSFVNRVRSLNSSSLSRALLQ